MNVATSSNRFNITPGLKSERFRADELGIHRITLARARAAGSLGFLLIGSRVFRSDFHITEWLARNERCAPKGVESWTE
jgi:hypothetical protein